MGKMSNHMSGRKSGCRASGRMARKGGPIGSKQHQLQQPQIDGSQTRRLSVGLLGGNRKGQKDLKLYLTIQIT